MSLYVHPDNQKLLWNIFNTNPYLNQHFLKYAPAQKEGWFKSIIELFYNKNKDINLDINQVHQLNKDTLYYMIQIIRMPEQKPEPVNKPSDSVPSPSPWQTPTTTYPEFTRFPTTVAPGNVQTPEPFTNVADSSITKESISNSRQDQYNKQFIERQQNYNSMLEKKPPAAVDFRDKVSDSVITNMDELILKHKRDRDEELKKYAPPPIVQPVQAPTPIQQVSSIKIDSSPNNIQFETEEIEPESKDKKSVTWSHENETKELPNDSNIVEKLNQEIASNKVEIDTLRIMMYELSKTIISLSNDIVNIKARFDFGGIESPRNGALAINEKNQTIPDIDPNTLLL